MARNAPVLAAGRQVFRRVRYLEERHWCYSAPRRWRPRNRTHKRVVDESALRMRHSPLFDGEGIGLMMVHNMDLAQGQSTI